MIKVVIQGASGLKNSGDEAILQAILQGLDENYEVTVVTFQTEYAGKMHPGISFVKLGSKECMEAVKQCEIFILGGGGLLQDETSIYNVSRWLQYLKYCIKNGKKTYLYANSIGPVHFAVNKKKIQKWLKRVDKITVRDELSKELLDTMGICRNVEVTADPVFNIEVNENTDVSRFSLPEKYAVICVRHWYDTHPFIPVSICTKLNIRNKENVEKYQKYIRKVAQLADYLSKEKGLPVVFLPFLYGRDNKVAYDIKQMMKESTGLIIEDEYLKPDEAIRIIANSRLLIGMRLHSIIYGAISRTPMLIMSYSSKVRGMAEYLHMDEYMVDTDTMECENMKVLVNKIVESKAEIKEKLQLAVQEAKEKERRNIEILKELCDNV